MTTINQLPSATNPQPTDLIPVQTASGTTESYTPANLASAMELGAAAYLGIGGGGGVVIADDNGNIPSGSMPSVVQAMLCNPRVFSGTIDVPANSNGVLFGPVSIAQNGQIAVPSDSTLSIL